MEKGNEIIMHQVKTDIFEGPLELLLDLIEKKKLSINQVSLAAIADEYVTEVKRRASVMPEEVAQFLVVASMLMLIKSRSLLPDFALSDEEEGSIHDLENRLALLQRVRALSMHIAQRAKAGGRMYARTGIDFPILFYPPEGVTPQKLLEAARQAIDVLTQYTKSYLPKKSLQTIISLEEKIQELMGRVEQAFTHSFRSLVASTKEKTEIIVSFLALLELVKQGHVAVAQGDRYGDISIQKIPNI